MARLSQKQLEEIAKSRKIENEDNSSLTDNESKYDSLSTNPKIINEILGDGMQPIYKYKLPEVQTPSRDEVSVPFVSVEEYPKINIQGKYSSYRQVKGANLYILKEIDHVLSRINEGKNKNATINFLIWVGLQSLKGINHEISIQIHDSTYADGGIIHKYISNDI
ncbi:hypothetical protein M1146_03275 [Patescibacteria group bacterium]|nr:hypothetical protein [Patescibacteria group bacterium]